MLKFHPLKAEELRELQWQSQPLAAYLPAYFDPAEALKREDLLLTVFDGSRPVGMLVMRKEPTNGRPNCAVIETAVLLPEYRRHGLGRMLTALAAGAAAERGIWFLAAQVLDTPEAKGFASAMHFRQTEWYPDYLLLDLSDVEGMRHG
ncbi:MAG: GNAT family N-acetyltransferase [Oscillospiraceae bacterium]|nr:GNAT family N-acetyltransferase [Oscillospiraceae bacterium]